MNVEIFFDNTPIPNTEYYLDDDNNIVIVNNSNYTNKNNLDEYGPKEYFVEIKPYEANKKVNQIKVIKDDKTVEIYNINYLCSAQLAVYGSSFRIEERYPMYERLRFNILNKTINPNNTTSNTSPHQVASTSETPDTPSLPDSQHEPDAGGLSKIITNSTKPKQLDNNMPQYVITLDLLKQQERNIFIQYLEDNNIPHQWIINRRYQDGGHTKNSIMERDGLVIVSSRQEAQDIINGLLQNPQTLHLKSYFDIVPLVLDNYLDEELREMQAVVTIEPWIST